MEEQCAPAAAPSCRTVTETVTESECSAGASQQQCDTVYEEQCGTRLEQQCTTVNEQECQVTTRTLIYFVRCLIKDPEHRRI